MNDRDKKFVQWLIELSVRPNARAVLADLRRGLGQPPGLAPSVGRYVQPFLSADDGARREEVYYLVASLFGLHPAHTTQGNLGLHFNHLWETDNPPDNVARRFNVLVSADWDTLPDHLRSAVALLKANEQPVNWGQLLDDLLGWELPNAPVQLRWSRSFWRKDASTEDASTQDQVSA